MNARDGRAETIRHLATKHGFGEDAVEAMLSALRSGGGTMAQFNHPSLGGMGQWSRGGMLMIGDMFNDALKARVGALANELSRLVLDGGFQSSGTEPSVQPERNWWPQTLGSPSSSGGQNGDLYAVFPAAQRLAVKRAGRVTVYDTGEHRISGVSQQQGSASRLSFSTGTGIVTENDLRRLAEEDRT